MVHCNVDTLKQEQGPALEAFAFTLIHVPPRFHPLFKRHICLLAIYYKKEKQRSCKPGSVPVTGAYLQTGVCHLSSTGVTAGIYRSTLRLGRTALPPHRSRLEHCRYTRTFNIRCAQHVCCHTPGGLLPRLLTLTCIMPAVIFFCTDQPSLTPTR